MPIDFGRYLRLVLLFAPAVGLSILGLTLALRSGEVGTTGTVRFRSRASNASELVFRLSLWILGIAAVGEMVGLRTVIQAD
jgi:hypothetical protein